MTIKPYRRSVRWSTARALDRIAAKEASVDREIARLEAESEALSLKLTGLRALKVELEAARSAELCRPRRRKEDSTVGLPLPEVAAGSGVSPKPLPNLRRLAKSHTFDPNRRCFLNPDRPIEGASSPQRPCLEAGDRTPRLERLASLLEIPGLLHASAIGEAGHRRYAHTFDRLIPECLGLGLADCFVDQVFSASFLQELTKAETPQDVLKAVTAS